jgi:hypothetical protein
LGSAAMLYVGGPLEKVPRGVSGLAILCLMEKFSMRILWGPPCCQRLVIGVLTIYYTKLRLLGRCSQGPIAFLSISLMSRSRFKVIGCHIQQKALGV